MHILFAGGGSAGHINPALAVADYIKNNDSNVKISYIGTKNKMESRLVPQTGYDFYTIDVAGLQRKITFENIGKNIVAIKKAIIASYKVKKLLKELKPDIVMGTGGYVSGPVLRAAAKLKIKTVIHEQNAFPGVTTKMLANDVDCVMLAMPEAIKHLKTKAECVITGNPVRESLLKIDRKTAREKLGLKDKPMILSFGGSLGARVINEAIVGLVESNIKNDRFYLFHATGKNGYNKMMSDLASVGYKSSNKNIRITEYIDNMDVMMAAADLLICRAGAITLSEIQVCGKASILIPSPYVAENHQFYNAMTLKNFGAAEIIEEKDVTPDEIVKTVDSLINHPGKLSIMSQMAKKNAIKDANKRIYDVIIKIFKQN